MPPFDPIPSPMSLNPNAPPFNPSPGRLRAQQAPLLITQPLNMNNQTPPPSQSQDLSICQLNCRSLIPKFPTIEQLILSEFKCQILCLSETWLSHEVPDSFLSIPSFNTFRRDRPQGKHGGGLLVYAAPHLRPCRRQELEHPDVECIVLEFSAPLLERCLLYFCYRPPSYPPEIFFTRVSSSLSKCPSSPLVLLGDFNAKNEQWTTAAPNSAGNHLSTLLDDHCLLQFVSEPTRYSPDHTMSSTLDLFATNRPDLVDKIVVSDPISDHSAVIAHLKTSLPLPHTKPFHMFDYRNADWAGLRAALYRIDLYQLTLNVQDINTAWQKWSNEFEKIIRHYVPLRTLSRRSTKAKIWITPELRLLSKKKMRLFRRARSTGLSEDWDKYKQY